MNTLQLGEREMSNGFLDKLKQGATEASKKAQVTIEINKIRSQIQGHEQTIQTSLYEIGKLVYSSFEHDNFAENESEIFSSCRDISSIKKDILMLEYKIKELRDEKECPTCASICTSETKFCSNCGHSFQVEAPPAAEEEAAIKHCTNCGTQNDAKAKFCGGCGNHFS